MANIASATVTAPNPNHLLLCMIPPRDCLATNCCQLLSVRANNTSQCEERHRERGLRYSTRARNRSKSPCNSRLRGSCRGRGPSHRFQFLGTSLVLVTVSVPLFLVSSFTTT